MKVIDLLNKIANGEKVPKEIIVYNERYIFDDFNKCYWNKNHTNLLSIYNGYIFKKELEYVEGIEDTPKEDKKIENLEDFDNLSGIEASGYCLNKIDILLEKGIKENRDKINEIIDYIYENVEK